MILTFNAFLLIEYLNEISYFSSIFIHAFTKWNHPINTFFFINNTTMKKNNESTIFVVGIAQVAFFLFIMLLIGVILG